MTSLIVISSTDLPIWDRVHTVKMCDSQVIKLADQIAGIAGCHQVKMPYTKCLLPVIPGVMRVGESAGQSKILGGKWTRTMSSCISAYNAKSGNFARIVVFLQESVGIG